MNKVEEFFASCPTGLEKVLEDELGRLGVKGIHGVRGGLRFTGTFDQCYCINLESRIASRLLWRVHQGESRTEGDVREAASALPWHEWFDGRSTIKVSVSSRSCSLKSLEYVTLTIKDAICDRFRDATGRRPSVDTRRPDIRIAAHLDATHLTLYVDTSGEALFKRGYRRAAGEAPLRENLAAGIVALSGWTPEQTLLDPMCGSGTILIEAAAMARGLAPGAGRRFAFERLNWFDPARWQAIRDRARDRERRNAPLRIYGSDRDPTALEAARENLRSAGLAKAVGLEQMDVVNLRAPTPEGVLVTNPPYGVRLSEREELTEFFRLFGSVLKRRFAGWRAYVLTADLKLPSLLRLAESRRVPLFNGPLDCRLFEFKMVSGSMRRRSR